jgi:competence protein ComEA
VRRFLLLISLLWMMTSAAFAGVNINTASQSQLETLPGIGPSKAAAILEYRGSNGPFTTVEQLDNVPGIGPATMGNLRSLVELGEGDAAPAEGTSAEPDSAEETTAPAVTTTPTGGSDRLNVNTATQSQLESLPGIGPSKAAAILQYRTDNGPFASCAALDAVNGIGPATVSALSDRCTVE